LLDNGHEVTVLSRNDNMVEGVIPVIAERSIGVKLLQGSHYDTIIDFICYEGSCVNDIFLNISFDAYILISTVWISKIEDSKHSLHALPIEIEKYLLGKKDAEESVKEGRKYGIPAISIRLPILSGLNDHTKRLMFYLDRMADGGGIIRINGGNNTIQIANSQDVSIAIALASVDKEIVKIELWDAMPEEEITVKNMLSILSNNNAVKWCDLSEEYLENEIPEYLENEPFWREYQIPKNVNNIFKHTNIVPRPLEEWIAPLRNNAKAIKDHNMRNKEIMIINKI